MEADDWTIRTKPYDLRQRLFLFGCLIIRLVQFLHSNGRIATELSNQVLRSGTSAGANYEEADDGSSGRDKRAKTRIALRELKETHFRLRLLHATGFLDKRHLPVLEECGELVKIVASIVRKMPVE